MIKYKIVNEIKRRRVKSLPKKICKISKINKNKSNAK